MTTTSSPVDTTGRNSLSSIFASPSAPAQTTPATQSADQGDQPSTAEPQNPPSPEVTEDVTSLIPSLPSKVGKITFDPHGDVILVIPSGRDPSAVARFQVNSVVLCLASPVFRAMLGPNSRFREGINLKLAAVAGGPRSSGSISTPMEMPLTDDDPDAFAVILRILHLDFDNIPPAMAALGNDEEQYKLYEMAIICDKYDMRHLLLYWLKLWTAPYLKMLNLNNIAVSTKTGTRWLFIAYAFGYESVFHSVSKELILHCHARSSGKLFLLSPKHDVLDTFYLPQSITDEISAKRQQALEAIVDAVHNVIERYSNPQKTHCKFGEPSCDAMILGLLFRKFREIQIYPEASVITKKSVEEVKSILKMIQFPKFIPINKPTGCCQKPQKIQTTQVFGLFGDSSNANQAACSVESRDSTFATNPGGTNTIRAPNSNLFGRTVNTTTAPTNNLFGRTVSNSRSNSSVSTSRSNSPTSASGRGTNTTRAPTSNLFGRNVSTSRSSSPTSAFGRGTNTTRAPTSNLFGRTLSTSTSNSLTGAFGVSTNTTTAPTINWFERTVNTTTAPTINWFERTVNATTATSPCVVKQDSTCANCQNPYQAPTGPYINHAEYCLPLTRLKKILDGIVGKVTGLEYSQFVRNDSEGKKAKPAKQVFADLWSTVDYTEVPKV